MWYTDLVLDRYSLSDAVIALIHFVKTAHHLN